MTARFRRVSGTLSRHDNQQFNIKASTTDIDGLNSAKATLHLVMNL